MSRRPVLPPPDLTSEPSAAPPAPDASQPWAGGVSPAVRAQLLATEHYSLVATRSMVQSEVLSRITTFLTLVSATIVSLALVGQVTRFDGRFITFALLLIGMVAAIGTLTQMRVGNASIEDLALVIGMNRLRAAYVEIDQAVEHYLVTSAHDDDDGLWQTYNPLVGRHARSNVLASSGAFITFVNSGLIGVFAALVALAFNAPGPLVAIVAVACGLSFLGLSVILGLRQYLRIRRRYVSQYPAPDTAGEGT
jgi:hypothetical protein